MNAGSIGLVLLNFASLWLLMTEPNAGHFVQARTFDWSEFPDPGWGYVVYVNEAKYYN
jgi:hypothetical protein